jgi:hypothetical protein
VLLVYVLVAYWDVNYSSSEDRCQYGGGCKKRNDYIDGVTNRYLVG